MSAHLGILRELLEEEYLQEVFEVSAGEEAQCPIKRRIAMSNPSEPIEEKGDGSGCRCGAYGRSECGCADADWTPKEVYRLRSAVIALEQKLLASEVRGGELVEALKKIAKHAQDVLEWNGRTGGTLVASAESYMALEALTTWNSLKGETEGK